MARIMFFLSLASSLYWLCGMGFEAVMQAEPPHYAYFASAVLLAIIIAAIIFRYWPEFLSPTGDPPSALKRYLFWSAILYVVTLPLGAALAYICLAVNNRGLSVPAGENIILIWSSALWLPLWWAPAGGVTVGWLRLKKQRAERHANSSRQTG